MGMLTQPIKRHGGKHYLADWILSHRPAQYITYCEPYFGGGSVLLKHDPNDHSEVVNDLDGHLMNFWAVIGNPELFEPFHRLMTTMPFCQSLFRACQDDCDPDEAFSLTYEAGQAFDARVVRAGQFFVLSRQSRQGLCKDFATLSKKRTRRGMNEQVSQWLGAIEGLPDIHQRLKRVVILNADALRVIEKMDDPLTWFYLDPPYRHETRTDIKSYGQHEVNDQHHFDLLALLAHRSFIGKFSLSGYHSREYDDVASACGWRCVEKVIDNKASSAATKPKMTECLWMNY